MPVPKSGRGTNTKKNGTSVGQEIHSDNTLYQGMRPSFYALKGNMENRTKTGIKGIVQNGTAKPEANGHNNSTAIGGKGDNCNGFTNGSSKVYSGNGKNKLKKANGNKSDGIPSYVHSNGKRNESSKDFQLDDADCQSNGSQGHQDAVPIRKRIALQEFYESDIAVDMANEKNPIAANKCSEEPLSFFQPDFEDALKSPTVEELCAKWPVLGNIQEPNDSKDEPVNDVPLLISRAKQNVRSKISSKWGNSNKTASEIQAPSDITLSPDGASQRHQMNVLESIQPDSKTACKSDLGDARADTSNCSLSKVGKLPSLSCYGNKRARHPSESSAWANSQQSSPRKSNAPRFEGRGQNGNQNSMGRGGPRKNKTAKKFNTQGLQFDNKKHFGLSGPIQNQRSPIAQYDKSGTPVGYYNNHEAFMGQHLIASMPSLIGPEVVQPQMMNEMAQPLMVNPGATQPQNMNPSGQYTVAILPNGAYGTNQWIDVGNQQYLVHQSEMGPITIANVLPYVVPYTPGLPNTGIPMMIPAIAPPGIATPVQESVNTSQATADPNCLDTQLNGNYYSNNTQVDVNNQDLAASQSVSVHTGPILAYSQSPNHFSPAHHGKPTEYGYPQETSGNPVVYPPNNGWFQTSHDNPGNGEAALNETMHNSNNIIATTQSDTPKSAHTRNPDGSSLQQTHSPNAITKLNVAAPSAIAADYHTPRSYPGTPTHNIVNSGNGTPVALKSMPVTPVHCSTPPTQTVAPSSATGDTNDSPLTIAPKTPKDAPKTGKGSASKIRMMSVSQVEKIQRMSSANGKRLPLNSRNKDSPNHMPAAPQEVQEDLVKFICDSWNKVHQEYQKGSNGVAYYDQEPCPLEGFVPFDLEAYWGNRLVQNMTNQNIPTQNI